MELFNKTTNTIVTEQEFRSAFPNTSFPAAMTKDILEEFGYTVVLAAPQPVVSELQNVIRDGVEVDSKGNTIQKFKVVNKFDTPEAEAEYLSNQLEAVKVAKRAEVDRIRKERESAGLFYKFEDALEGTVQTRNDTDIRNIQAVTTTGLVLKAQGVSTPAIPFRDGHDVIHVLTPDGAISMGMAVQSFIADAYSWAWNLKGQIDASKTVSEVNSIEVI